MAPTLSDSCSILFDRNRRTRWERGIYVVRKNGVLFVKCVAERDRARELASNHPVVAPKP